MGLRVDSVQVLRTGMSGAPLSRYVHMLRAEGLAYRPDVVIINLNLNEDIKSR